MRPAVDPPDARKSASREVFGDDIRQSRDDDIASGYVGVHLKRVDDATKCSWLTVTRRHLPGVQGQRSPPGITVIGCADIPLAAESLGTQINITVVRWRLHPGRSQMRVGRSVGS